METIQTVLDDIINQIVHSTNKKQKIGPCAFAGCAALTTINLPAGFIPPQDIKHWTSKRNELIGMTTWTRMYDHGADFIILYDDGTVSMSVHEIKSR